MAAAPVVWSWLMCAGLGWTGARVHAVVWHLGPVGIANGCCLSTAAKFAVHLALWCWTQHQTALACLSSVTGCWAACLQVRSELCAAARWFACNCHRRPLPPPPLELVVCTAWPRPAWHGTCVEVAVTARCGQLVMLRIVGLACVTSWPDPPAWQQTAVLQLQQCASQHGRSLCWLSPVRHCQQRVASQQAVYRAAAIGCD